MTQEPSILLVTIPDLPYDNNLNCKEWLTDCSIRVVTLLTDTHLWLVQNLQFLPHDLVPYWTLDNFWQQDPYSINTPISFSINGNTCAHRHRHKHTRTHYLCTKCWVSKYLAPLATSSAILTNSSTVSNGGP